MEKEMDKPSEKKMFKPIFWSAIGGAIIILIFVFSIGWVTTSGSAKEQAQELAHQEVVDNLSDICVAQFQTDPNKEELFKKLKATSSWIRGEFVKEKGWATMPGKKEPDGRIAGECATRILELKK